MIRGLILFYLNIKSTHGYEIQRFIQISGIDRWAKIQSGSIYYALSKLEKEKNICILSEENVGQRTRKIYGITEKGKETLRLEMIDELSHPIQNIGSTKFIIEPMMNTLSTEEITSISKHHIEELQSQLKYWKQWEDAKTAGKENRLIQLSFSMSIRSLEDQIAWHEELIEHLDYYKEESKTMLGFLQSFDADRFEPTENLTSTINSLEFAKKLKDTIQNDPNLAIQNLDRLIEELNRRKQ